MIEIKEEDVRKAHEDGCSDVKRVLETLFPKVFEVKYPCYQRTLSRPREGAILLMLSPCDGMCIYSYSGSSYHVGEKITGCVGGLTPIKGIKEIE